MSADNAVAAWDPMVLAGHFQSIAEQSQKLMLRFLSRNPDDGHLGMSDPSRLGDAFLELMTKMMNDPAAVAAAQIDLFNDSLTLWRHAAERMLNIQSPDAALPRDKRFSHPEWSENATFSFIRESYLVASKSLLSTVRGVKDLDSADGAQGGFLHPTVRRRDVALELHRHQSRSAVGDAEHRRGEPAARARTRACRSRSRRRPVADRHDRHERVPARREHRHDAGQGRVPERAPCSSSSTTQRRRRCASGRW